jgi:hypothetical protein
MVKENPIKRKLKADLQRYVFKAIPQGFSSTLHTNSEGKLTSITFEYKLPNGTVINPASMLTNVMVQCTDSQMHQFYNSPHITAGADFSVLTMETPLDISLLNGIDIWYDDLLGNQYNIIWR